MLVKEKEQSIDKLEKKMKDKDDQSKDLLASSKQASQHLYEARKNEEAIKKLTKKVQDKDTELERLTKQNKELQAKVASFESLLAKTQLEKNQTRTKSDFESEQAKVKARQALQRASLLESKQ